MGVDYRVWVIPQQRAFRPNADQVASLANALREGNWVPQCGADGQHSEVRELLPGDDPVRNKPARKHEFPAEPLTAAWVESHSEHELVLDWHVQDLYDAGVQYPFVFDPYPESGSPYFFIRLILGENFFYHTGENVMPFEEQATRCRCDEQLTFWGWSPGVPSGRIHRECPKCGRNFDPSAASCDVIDGWTGERSPLAGGLTFRFALAVDCHKYFPHEEEAARRFNLRSEFLNLWHSHIQAPFELVTTFD